jgi:hypothetical protein
MKKKFVLRMDEDLYEAIEKWAADEFRSVNGQIEWMLSKSLSTNGRLKEKKSKKNEINTQKE